MGGDPNHIHSQEERMDYGLVILGWKIGVLYKRRKKACWCRLGDMSEALLCVLQIDSLTIYNTSGEVVSIPLARTVTSIWPLPFGLLLQQATEGISPAHLPFSSSSPLLGGRDITRPKREIGHSPRQNFSLLNTFDYIIKGDGASFSSHLILKDPLEEPHSTYIEERGKLNIMKEFDERTIWTSDLIPLMASYNKGKMQHSVWVAEVINSCLEVSNASLSDVIPAGVLPNNSHSEGFGRGRVPRQLLVRCQLTY
ncbi:Anaphase-promoting complex subunit 1 [Vitis vinifera]|uniref:Anaphase-promoting complex subunit 1 n=1 Tax=Vitis vinifera TaxID=29760 RepID=A0A438J2E0_VITVI|nr:Anaphase-promoting complex subunit 1 [Vitis vinifera]